MVQHWTAWLFSLVKGVVSVVTYEGLFALLIVIIALIDLIIKAKK